MSTTASTSPAGTRAPSRAPKDAGLVRERATYLQSSGMSPDEVRAELKDEGFSATEINTAVPKATAPKAKKAATPATPPAQSPAPASSPTPATPKAPSSPSLPSLRLRTPGTPAGMFLAIVGYPVVLAYLQGGGAGLRGWFRAKFLNQTPTDAGIQNEVFPQLSQLYGGGASATPTAALSTYGNPPPATPSTPKAPSVPAGSGAGGRAVAFAAAQLGKPYRYGANGPDSWDCSSLTQASWRAAGVSIPRTTFQQILIGRRVAKKDLIPGDLVFPTTGHVQLYIGGGQVIEAPRTGIPVRVAALGTILMARRPG